MARGASRVARSKGLMAGLALAWVVAGMAPQPAAAQSLRERLAERRAAQGQEGAGAQSALAQQLSGMGQDNQPWAGPYPEGARVSLDLAYGSDPDERLDVYAPQGPGPHAVVVMVHGGGWARGDKRSAAVVANKARAWLPKGVALVSVGYPMIPKADPRQQAVEVGRALAWLAASQGRLGLDMGRMALMGHSAGAHLVALLASEPGIAVEGGYAGSWRAVVALDGGALDVEDTMSRRHFGLFDKAFGADPQFWRKASPMARLSQATAPILLVCSEPRRESCAQSRAYQERDRGLGGAAEVMAVQMGHGQINKELGFPGPYTDGVEAFLRRAGVMP